MAFHVQIAAAVFFKGLEKILVLLDSLRSFDVGVSSTQEMCSIHREEHHAVCLAQAPPRYYTPSSSARC